MFTHICWREGAKSWRQPCGTLQLSLSSLFPVSDKTRSMIQTNNPHETDFYGITMSYVHVLESASEWRSNCRKRVTLQRGIGLGGLATDAAHMIRSARDIPWKLEGVSPATLLSTARVYLVQAHNYLRECWPDGRRRIPAFLYQPAACREPSWAAKWHDAKCSVSPM